MGHKWEQLILVVNFLFGFRVNEFPNKTFTIQGGSDKSGILKIFYKNHIAQLNIIHFFKPKKRADEHIENQVI
jgi:hypothetical protein